ncbi:single-strand DNA endonuclease ASTE1 [Chaetodon trifascialis]|uniref:single-strand DNA endonuclease ASTE1 n=1 Tax=Chaetodon trifascialis TaxID=109706 RepID=UPI003993A2AE
MGVRGLTRLIEAHPQIYLDVQFSRRRLLIDGYNLLYLLYFKSGLDQNHGGEYAAFEELIEKFVKVLRDCKVAPYVVLDGGADYNDRKLETLTQRAADGIRRACEAAQTGKQKYILPQLVKLVFKQTLARLEVPVAQCYGEADQQIAALAKEWECPVLSNDGDFFIFDLPAGLLPLSHFQWEAVDRSGSQSFIPCKSYKTSSFCTLFNLQHQLLPAFACLAGNDYVNLQRLEPSISWTPGDLEGLLCWLRGFDQPQEALNKVLELMGAQSRARQEEVRQALSLGMEEYQLPSSPLKRFFIHGVAPPFPEEQVAGLVPDWTRLPLTQGRLTSDILDVLLLKRMSLSCTVDGADMPSAHLTSRPLRQVMYGLLQGKEGPLEVTERDRDGLQLTDIPVLPAFTWVTQQLTLSSLDKAEPSLRLQVLLEALGVTEASLSHLPPQLRLPVAVTWYWLKRAQPRPEERLLKALLLGLSDGDALRHRAVLQTQQPQALDVGVVHAFNQWQSCLKDSVHLNQLLGFPLPEPHIAQLYEGTLVHHLVHLMKTGGKLKPFLKSGRSGVARYQSMLAAIRLLHTKDAPSPAENHMRAPSPRRGRRWQSVDDPEANLQWLFLCEDNEVGSVVKALEDLDLHELVSVKTRYRAKERSDRCNNPDLARKQDRRGQDLL